MIDERNNSALNLREDCFTKLTQASWQRFFELAILALASASSYKVKGKIMKTALLDFLEVIGFIIGEISKRSCCIYEYRSDKRTVDLLPLL